MNFLKKTLFSAIVSLGLMTAPFTARAESPASSASSALPAISLASHQSMEIFISDLGLPPDRAANNEPPLRGIEFHLYDSEGNTVFESPAQVSNKNGFVYIRLTASTCETGMRSCELVITESNGMLQKISLKPLGDRLVARPLIDCEERCNHRILTQQNLLDSVGNTVYVGGHVDHGKTTLTAAIPRVD